jgi:hypothetical protein
MFYQQIMVFNTSLLLPMTSYLVPLQSYKLQEFKKSTNFSKTKHNYNKKTFSFMTFVSTKSHAKKRKKKKENPNGKKQQ